MSTTSGKKFENNWRDSIPPNIFFYRFNDGTSAWDGSKPKLATETSETRFQAKNLCDCEMFDGNNLYLLELKSHKGASLPYAAFLKKNIKGKFDPKDEKCISQILKLSKASTYKNIIAGFVIHFADIGTTYFCKADDVLYFISHEVRKSIPISWCEEWGIQIFGKLKKVNYSWDIKSFVENKPVEIPPVIPKWELEQDGW